MNYSDGLLPYGAHNADELALFEIKAKRDQLLQESDWTQLPDAPLTEMEKLTWREYRQVLRDVPRTESMLIPITPIDPSERIIDKTQYTKIITEAL